MNRFHGLAGACAAGLLVLAALLAPVAPASAQNAPTYTTSEGHTAASTGSFIWGTDSVTQLGCWVGLTLTCQLPAAAAMPPARMDGSGHLAQWQDAGADGDIGPGSPYTLGALNAVTAAIDTRTYNEVLFDVSGTFVGTVSYQENPSGDLATWKSLLCLFTTTSSSSIQSSNTSAATVVCPVHAGSPVRATMSAYTSGSAVVAVHLGKTLVQPYQTVTFGGAPQPFYSNAGSTADLVQSNTGVTNSAIQISSAARTVMTMTIANTNSTMVYLQVFNALSASVTVGTTAPTFHLPVQPNQTITFNFGPNGIYLSAALSIAAATTPTGGTAPSTALPSVTTTYR